MPVSRFLFSQNWDNDAEQGEKHNLFFETKLEIRKCVTLDGQLRHSVFPGTNVKHVVCNN